MTVQSHRNFLLRRARLAAALFAAIILTADLRAQPTEQTVRNRFLFVFETSRDMKPRVEAVQTALNLLFATSLGGQLHAGDSLGVWTFGQDLRPGDYPLQSWEPDNAVLIASNLVKFVGKQHYAKDARFEALPPVLNEVVQDSERLTVLIFCDGGTKFSGTPFDDGVNRVFTQKLDEQKKAAEPFVIILRSQLGQYVGCTMGLPPQPLNYPQFPPLPEPPPPSAPKVNNPPPPAPVVTIPPLIIIGKKITSSPPPSKAPPTNPPPVAPVASTNAPAATTATSLPANLPAQAATPANVVAPAGSHFLLIGAALLGAAVAVGIFVRLRSRRKDVSLITRSMNDGK